MSSVKNSVQKNRRARKGGKVAFQVVAENDIRLRQRTMLATIRRIQMGARLDFLDHVNLELFESVAEAWDHCQATKRKGTLPVVPGGGR